MTPNEVLTLLEKKDGTEFNRYLRELSAKNREEFLIERYLDQYFAAWDTYHTWLLEALPRGRH